MSGARPSGGPDLTGGEVVLQSAPSSEMCFLGCQPGGEFEEMTGAGRSLRKEEVQAGEFETKLPRERRVRQSQPNILQNYWMREVRWGEGRKGCPGWP